jgi:hypothetical protein
MLVLDANKSLIARMATPTIREVDLQGTPNVVRRQRVRIRIRARVRRSLTDRKRVPQVACACLG